MPGLIAVRKSAGQRRHLMQLQQGVATVDAMGGRTQAWASYGTWWASVESQPLVVSEIQASILFVVTGKYRADIVTKYLAGTQQRVVGGGQTLKVMLVVNPDQKNREVILHCAPILTP